MKNKGGKRGRRNKGFKKPKKTYFPPRTKKNDVSRSYEMRLLKKLQKFQRQGNL